ncbi:MAG TPA: pilus assembly protein [Candidatus Brocadiia bacterium]|nr:pilus assembly protein [Candidatus Brocadiia bacterium]
MKDLIHSNRGAASIEMAIIMPLYATILLAILFLGQLTLGLGREHQAAAFTAWIGAQTPAELVQRFFPWIKSQPQEDGSYGAEGEDQWTLAITNNLTNTPSAWPVERFEDCLAKISIGNAYQGSYNFSAGTAGGVYFVQTEFGRYLTHHGLSTTDGYPLTPRPDEVDALAEAINGRYTRWFAQRDVTLKLRFRPYYFRWIYGSYRPDLAEEAPLPQDPADQPGLTSRHAVIIRDPSGLTRSAAGENAQDASGVYGDMMELLTGSRADPLPAPVDPSLIQAATGGLMYSSGTAASGTPTP